MSGNNTELRQLLIIGLASRYALRVRAEGGEFIIEDIEEPARLPDCQHGIRYPGLLASVPVPGAAMNAAAHCVIDRVQLELKVIEQAGLAAYFLLVADCARYGRSIGANCLAIGSCPGSLVTYLLEISTVDPIRHGLLFERFWNPERINLPVIYLEFADDRLNDVIEYARTKCGSSPVAHLITDLESDQAADMPTLCLLGLNALAVLRRTCERVRLTNGTEVPIDHLPLDDAKTNDLLKSGDTGGIFQLESEGMRDLCRKFKPTSIVHITALITVHSVAPYWPGPAGFMPDFIAYRHGWRSIKYPHRIVEPVLRETYGVLLYQEQLMQVVQSVAGFTLGRADLLRRALAKRKDEEVAQHRIQFVKGAEERSRISESKGNQIFEWLEKCAGYSLNKSHAVAYAMLAYQTAYLKANHSAEFLSALTEADGGAELRDDPTPGRLSP